MDQYGSEQHSQLATDPDGLTQVDYSTIQGWTGSYGGVGNTGVDPMFVDADGADDVAGTEDDDLRLLPGSPAINSGDPSTSYLPSTDLDGHARVLCGRVDIGAYEFGIGDYNCDQTVDLSDFATWSVCMTGPLAGARGSYDPDASAPGCEAFDFNADSAIDLHDFAEWQSLFVIR